MEIQPDRIIAARGAGRRSHRGNDSPALADSVTTGSPGSCEAGTVERPTLPNEMHKALAMANGAPDVRVDLVAEVKRRVEIGSYSVDVTLIARRMIDTRA